MAENDDLWRRLVNNLPDKMPDEGTEAPDMETIPEQPLVDGETPVLMQKIITEVYAFTSLETGKMFYGDHLFQDVQILGQMRLADGLALINKAKKRRRRKGS